MGPNGSGKSNIVDALRWVFGEQNPRLLRGSRWEDVIFAGSATRRPLGVAEVSVTLDNADGILPVAYREVEITRRLLRSGDAEYSINRVPCRLKDVIDLLAGTGTAGAAYAYMPQAAVDEILKSRPEDRRGVVEEAAGLARYRSRRQEAERRLAEADGARQRVRDLISELEGQLRPLRHEAAAAERYIALRTKREDLAARIWADTTYHLDRRAADAVARRTEWQTKVAELAAMLADAVSETALLESALSEARQEREIADGRVRGALAAEHRLRSALAVLAERLEQQQRARAALANDCATLAARLSQADLALAEACALAGQLDEAHEGQSTVDGLAHRLEQSDARLREARAAAELAARASAVASRQAAEQNTEWARLQERAASARNQVEMVSAALLARRREMAVAAADLEKVVGQQAEVRSAVDSAARQLNEVRTALAEVERTVSQSREEHARRQSAQAKLEGELVVAQQTLAELEATALRPPLAAAARTVARLAREGSLSATVTPLAELLEVEPGWEAAVATALGLAQHALVVDDWRAVDAVIAQASGAGNDGVAVLMAADAAGGAGFDAAPQDGQPLQALVRTRDPRALPQGSVDRLLAGYVCVADLQAAVEAQAKGWVRGVLMPDGAALLPGGVLIRAGSVGGPDSLTLSRERQRLATQIAAAAAATASGAAHLAKLAAAIDDAQAQVRRLAAQRSQAERTRATAQQRQQQLAHSEAQLTARNQSLKAEVDRLAGQLAAATTARDQAVLALTAIEGRLATAAAASETATQTAGQAAQMVAAAAAEAESLRLEQAKAGEVARAATQRLAGLQSEVARLQREASAAEQRMVSADQSLAALRTECETTKGHLKQAETARQAVESDAERLAIEVKGKELSLRNARQQLDQVGAAKADLDRRLARLAINIERMAGEARTLEIERRSMPMRFGDLIPQPEREVTACRAELAEVEADLAAVGTVDLGAAEQCRRLAERHGFLVSQEEDLAASAAALAASALELEREIETRFLRSFGEMRARFAAVFADLFGGGRADLELTDPDHPLISGVEVMAQPPGKRMTSLALLSGGERALTAIALLFAMVGNSKTGFCVLDEVDAYLDEPNCLRFRRYLRSLAGERQFLVVSHSKATMEAADVLYGLTMEEDGVSRMISVRLAEPGREGRVG